MKHVILGGGIAGLSAASEVRRWDPKAEVLILSDEPEVFYYRSALSFFLGGSRPLAQVTGGATEVLRKLRVRKCRATIKAIRPSERKVVLAEGEESYDRLLIALGAAPIRPPTPGDSAPEVLTYRSLEDAKRIRTALEAKQRLVIVGAGVLGLEVADAAVHVGASVAAILDLSPFIARPPLDDGATPTLRARLHRAGIPCRPKETVDEFLLDGGHLKSVRTTGGVEIPCDLVVQAIGVRPRMAVAEAAGITCDKGVLTNAHGETSVSGVYAAGDVAKYWDPAANTHLPCRTWMVATQMGRNAGANMVGHPSEYDPGVMINASKTFGGHYAIVGDVSGGAGVETVELPAGTGGAGAVYRKLYLEGIDYRRFYFRGDRLVGYAELSRDVSDCTGIRDLIRMKISCREESEGLLLGRVDPRDLLRKAQPSCLGEYPVTSAVT